MFSPMHGSEPAKRDGWLRNARAGSAEALGWLLQSFRPYLLLVACREVGSALATKVGPSDLVQETFLRASARFAQFHGQTPKEFRGWLRRILLNVLASFRREFQAADKRRLTREVALPREPGRQEDADLRDPADSPFAQAVARERDEALWRALARLREADRQIIHWRNYDRLSFEEIGSCLDKSAEAARKSWTRALARLERLLDPGHRPS